MFILLNLNYIFQLTKKINKHHVLSDSDDEVQINSSTKNKKAEVQLVNDVKSHIKNEPESTISPAEMFSKTSVTRETIPRVKKKPKKQVNL